MLAAVLEFVRDLAVLAAAAGVAWWCWDQYRTAAGRGDEAARLSLTAERQSADLRRWAETLDERTAAISAELTQLGQIARLAQSAHVAQAALMADAAAAAARDNDMRMAAKVRVHRLLQATTDPFLTFVEIERALGSVGRLAARSATGQHDAPEEGPSLAGDGLRRVLIDLVADGVVAQLDRDRYFVASDYETGDDDDENEDDDRAS